jgi:hypothetical protein
VISSAIISFLIGVAVGPHIFLTLSLIFDGALRGRGSGREGFARLGRIGERGSRGWGLVFGVLGLRDLVGSVVYGKLEELSHIIILM